VEETDGSAHGAFENHERRRCGVNRAYDGRENPWFRGKIKSKPLLESHQGGSQSEKRCVPIIFFKNVS